MLNYSYTLYIYIYIYYFCISLKSAFVRTTKSELYWMRSVTFHKTFKKHVHFQKWVVFNHSGSTYEHFVTAASRTIFSGLKSCRFIVYEFLVGASRFVAVVLKPTATPLLRYVMGTKLLRHRISCAHNWAVSQHATGVKVRSAYFTWRR